MVQFTPYESPEKVKEYDFREPEGRKANAFWGDLLKGGSDLLDSGIKAVDNATKLTLDDATRNISDSAKTQDIRDSKELVGNILAVNQKGAQTATGGAGGVSGNASVSDPSALINAPAGSSGALNTVPGPISGEMRYIDKMNEGMKQGHFDSERFYGEVQQRTANLISRYPGYADYIQSKVTHYLGTDPANAQREHLQQTIAQLLGTSHTQTAQEKWTHEVMTNYAAPMGSEWTAKAIQAGSNIDTQNAYRVQATTQLNKEHRIKAGISELTLDKDATAVRDTKAQTSFSGLMDNEYGKLMTTSTLGVDAGGNKYTMPDVHASIAQQRLTGKIDWEDNQKRALAIGGAESAFMANFEKEWIKPRFDPNEKGEYTNSYSTLITAPGAKEAIMKKYQTGFTNIKEQIGAGLFHLATTNASMNTNLQDNALLQALKQEGVAYLGGLSKALGPSADKIIGNADTQSGYKLSSQLGRQALEAFQAKNIGGGAAGGNNLMAQVNKIADINNADHRLIGKQATAKEMEVMMTQLTNVINMPNSEAALPIKMNIMSVLSHPETTNFLNKVSKPQQFNAYSTLFGSDITNFIKDHQGTEMWTRYKDTAGQSFAMIYGNFANDLKVGVRNDYRGTFTWEEKSQQIVYTKDRALGQPIDRNTNPAEQATNVLNQGLRVYGGILAAEGQKITPETLAALGIDLNRPEGNPTIDGIKKAWVKAFTSEPTKRPEGISTPGGRPKRSIDTSESKPSNPASPGDEGNGGISRSGLGSSLSLEEIDSHMSRPFKIDGKEVSNPLEKAKILNSIVVMPGGKYYYRQGNKLVPVNL